MSPLLAHKKTNWPLVLIAISAGCAAAAHIGKAPVAIPTIVRQMSLDLSSSALIASIYNLIAAVFGLLVGFSARRVGPKLLLVAGLTLLSSASVTGAVVGQYLPLLITRIIEGLGFVMASVAAPSVIAAATIPTDRRLALGLWGAYVPAGSSAMMVVGAFALERMGWQGLWYMAGVVTAVAAIIVQATVPSDRGMFAGESTVEKFSWLGAAREAISTPTLLLAGCFLAYAAMYLSLVSLLPLMLVGSSKMSASVAGTVGACVAAANVAGNVASGVLAHRGWRTGRLVTIAAVTMGLMSLIIFSESLPITIRVLAALTFTGIGGLVPGALLGAGPRYAKSPSVSATIMGLMLQGAAIGQVLGPLAFANVVQGAGSWQAGWQFMAVVALGLCAMGLLLDRQSQQQSLWP